MSFSRRFQRLSGYLLAELLFFLRALRLLVGPVFRAVIIGFLGALILHFFGGRGDSPAPDWATAAYDSYKLLMGEMLDDLPEAPLAQAILYLQPVLGILLMAEGLLKLGFDVFDKEANAEEWFSMRAYTSRKHVVVCGLGTVGFRVVEELTTLGEQVFAIERKKDSSFIDQARELGVQVLVGDARSESVLRQANIEHARAILVVTDDDLANMEIAMDARELAPHVPIVLRLYDQRLASKVKQTLGVQVSVSTSKLAGPLLASAALDPAVVGTHRIGERLMLVVQLRVRPGSPMLGWSLGRVQREARMTVIAFSPQDEPWVPNLDLDRELAIGDLVQLLLPSDQLEEAHRLMGEKRSD